MKFNDVPVAMTTLQPYCVCGESLPWPDGVTIGRKDRPVLLTCPRCHEVVRAQYLIPMAVPRLPAPGSGDSCDNQRMHATHQYDTQSDTCRRCGLRLTLSHMGPVNPAICEPCRGCSTSLQDLTQSRQIQVR